MRCNLGSAPAAPRPHQPWTARHTTMSSVGVKRKLPPPPGSPAYIAAHAGGRGRGDGGRNTTATGRGGRGRRGRGRGSGRGGGRGQAGRGGAGAGAARVRGERAMDRQLGQDAPPPESLHKYVRGPGNSTEVSGSLYLSVDSSCMLRQRLLYLVITVQQ